MIRLIHLCISYETFRYNHASRCDNEWCHRSILKTFSLFLPPVGHDEFQFCGRYEAIFVEEPESFSDLFLRVSVLHFPGHHCPGPLFPASLPAGADDISNEYVQIDNREPLQRVPPLKVNSCVFYLLCLLSLSRFPYFPVKLLLVSGG